MSAPSGSKSARVAVFGLGYVGCVTAACLAESGHDVVGVDVDEFKVRMVNEGRAPFYEPGLEDLVQSGVAAGRLLATSSIAEALKDAEIALLCVGTPSERNGNLGLDQLRRVSEQIAQHLAPGARLIVTVRSTVFPGTCEDVVLASFRPDQDVAVVSNPEFLREGSAVQDFREPSLLVVGGTDLAAVERVASLYRALPVEPCLVSLRTAEMIKYACNSFHAVKIAFANEIGAFAESLGINGREVMDTVCRDHKLNVSPAYLKPGFAFGGSCLPKDLRALVFRAGRQDVELPLLKSVLPSNDEHLARALRKILDLPPSRRIGVFGLAFKENTDDLRESPVVALIEHLIGKGRDLRVYDPHIQLEQIYGSNRNFILSAVPHIRRLMQASLENLLASSEHLVLAQKPAPAVWQVIEESGLPVIDLVGFAASLRPAATAVSADS
jgi:GDP-mannose 6-dehydrogenase